MNKWGSSPITGAKNCLQEAPQQGIVKESHLQYQKGQYTKFEKVPFKLCFVLFKLSGCSNVSRAKPRNAAVGNSERMVTSMELDRKTVKKSPIDYHLRYRLVFKGCKTFPPWRAFAAPSLGLLMSSHHRILRRFYPQRFAQGDRGAVVRAAQPQKFFACGAGYAAL